ncbi:MAG: PTS sugar transporter subunit IIA [Phycisphaerae bacterium]|nr:PTS sugar transporter subunit IIA [Phycisphaerae bacterium]
MPYRNMTLEELARHIGMDAREVRKLADRGRLPGQYIGGEWRFNRAQMLDWLQHEMHFLDVRHLQNLERATADDPDKISVSNLLAPEAIDLALPARSKPSVLRELVKLASRTGLVYDADGLIDALEEREAMYSTALPNGFAFPHPRRPQPYATGEPLICLARVPHGLPFGASDGHLTDLFVFVCSHDPRQHLHVLARLSMLFTSELPDKLREAESPAEALQLVLETESRLLEQRK